jgi:hypothetical protein
MSYNEEVNPYERNNMLNNLKLEMRLKKDRPEDNLVDVTPSVTKEDILAISKNVVKYVAGAALIILAGSAVIDTAKYGAMTAIENRSNKEDD